MLYHICAITQAFATSLKNPEPYLKNHEQGLATPIYSRENIKKTKIKITIFYFYRTTAYLSHARRHVGSYFYPSHQQDGHNAQKIIICTLLGRELSGPSAYTQANKAHNITCTFSHLINQYKSKAGNPSLTSNPQSTGKKVSVPYIKAEPSLDQSVLLQQQMGLQIQDKARTRIKNTGTKKTILHSQNFLNHTMHDSVKLTIHTHYFILICRNVRIIISTIHTKGKKCMYIRMQPQNWTHKETLKNAQQII